MKVKNETIVDQALAEMEKPGAPFADCIAMASEKQDQSTLKMIREAVRIGVHTAMNGAKSNGAKIETVTKTEPRTPTCRHPKPEELRTLKDLMAIPEEQLSNEIVEEFMQLPVLASWQYAEMRKRIVEHHEKRRTPLQWLEAMPASESETSAGNFLTINIPLRMHVDEWTMLAFHARKNGVSVADAAGDELAEHLTNHQLSK